MKTCNRICLVLIALLAGSSAPAFATVAIVSFTPSLAAPQPIGSVITWTAVATDSNAGPLTFRFVVIPPGGAPAIVKDFNTGTNISGTWTSRPFVWVPTGKEGTYTFEVVIKDFIAGESSSSTTTYQINPLVTGNTPVVEATANPLVALFSAPSCGSGSSMRVAFQEQSGGTPAVATNWVPCHPPATMTFEIAGMYPSTPYNMYAQTKNTNGRITNGPTLTFTTGALPTTIVFPTYTVLTPASDTTYPVILHNQKTLAGGAVYPDVATDLQGQIMWYYSANDVTLGDILTRPLRGGGILTIQDDDAWNPTATKEQLLRQIDLAGNLVQETNVGVIQQQLLALGAVDGGPCSVFSSPPPIGAGCTGAFHHDAIQTLPNGWTAALLDVEKIYPPGTQDNTSPDPVDIIGDMIIVMDTNWQVQWYWDSFDPDGGAKGYDGLRVSRIAPLNETCGTDTSGCPPVFLLGNGIAPLAQDWLHANSLYYWPNDGSSSAQPGDIIWSSRNQDLVVKIDYKDGNGSGDILWTMGPNNGNFTFVNVYNDPWPWFSHQHDVGIEDNGQGVMSLFDNGNTRISDTIFGLGENCAPFDCDSRGMALTFNGSTKQVTPVVSFDLGSYSPAMGSAQLLGNGNYFFDNPVVVLGVQSVIAYDLEIAPFPPAPEVAPANFLLDLAGPEQYRAWQLPSLYFPPTT
jgi:hypothetical protein